MDVDGAPVRHGDVTLWWADLTAAEAALEASLPERERARLDELTPGADRARRMVGAALLRRAVRSHRQGAGASGGDGPQAEVVVDRTCSGCGAQHGRPVVAGGPHVSVAHAGVLVLVATCASAPVGVDVERVARFGGSNERARAWVLHEARVKAGLEGPAGLGGGVVAVGTHDAAEMVAEVAAPRSGYVAALAVRGG